jgi:hypothetical protein
MTYNELGRFVPDSQRRETMPATTKSKGRKTAVPKPARGTESRMKDWEAILAQFEKTHFAFEESFAVRQELLKTMAPKLAEQWGIDLEKLTKMSRESAERISRKLDKSA